MMVDQGYLLQRTALSRADCVDLLSRAHLARVILSVRCLPAALPALIAVLGQRLLVASTECSVNLAARRGDVLSIQIDGLDDDGATWSVMASGIAAPAQDFGEIPSVLSGAIGRGATLISLPLSVVVGERVG
jgi:hypothetical protein